MFSWGARSKIVQVTLPQLRSLLRNFSTAAASQSGPNVSPHYQSTSFSVASYYRHSAFSLLLYFLFIYFLFIFFTLFFSFGFYETDTLKQKTYILFGSQSGNAEYFAGE